MYFFDEIEFGNEKKFTLNFGKEEKKNFVTSMETFIQMNEEIEKFRDNKKIQV